MQTLRLAGLGAEAESRPGEGPREAAVEVQKEGPVSQGRVGHYDRDYYHGACSHSYREVVGCCHYRRQV